MKIQTPEHQQALRDQFKVRDPFELSLEATISPVAIVSDLGPARIASTGYPRNCMGFASIAAGGVGTNAECALRAPAGTGKLFHVTQGMVSKSTTAGIVDINMGNGVALAAATALAAKAFTDQRVGASAPDAILDVLTPITASIDGTRVGRIRFEAADVTVLVPLDVILGENDWVAFVQGTTNEALNATFYWTEYLLANR